MKSFPLVTAKYTRRCTECQEYIVAGRDKITKLHASNSQAFSIWVHEQCYMDFWNEIRQDKIRQDAQEDQIREQESLTDLFERIGDESDNYGKEGSNL